MSYKEFAQNANRHRYMITDELIFSNRTNGTEKKNETPLFEIPLFGRLETPKKAHLVKGGEIKVFENLNVT